MKKIIFTFLLILLTATSHADMSDKEISDSLKCAGIFTSTQFIKQGELPNGDLAYKENSLAAAKVTSCLLYTSPSPRDGRISRMPSSA